MLVEHALTIRPPWAWAIAEGHKSIEIRTWRPPASLGRVAIHSGAGRGIDAADVAVRSLVAAPDEWPRARILATAAVVDVVDDPRRLDRRARRWWDAAVATLSEPPRRPLLAWVLRDVRRLALEVPCGGHLWLWRIPERLRCRIA